jgi:hypothetical protein
MCQAINCEHDRWPAWLCEFGPEGCKYGPRCIGVNDAELDELFESGLGRKGKRKVGICRKGRRRTGLRLKEVFVGFQNL